MTSPVVRKCPVCGKPRSAEHAPFCSTRCKDRDLLQWLQDIGASAEVLQQARQLLRADHRIDSQRMIDLAGKALRDPRSTIASTLRLVQYLEIVNLLAFPA